MVEHMVQLPGDKIIIFPGDIFHRGFVSISAMTRVLSLFMEMNRLTDNHVYSCVGNHELSYRVNNPFWMMAKDNTGRYPEMHGLEAYGIISPGIQIVDNLTVGPLDFIFGHYEREDFEISTDKDCVLITHNSVLEPVIDEAVNKMHVTESVAEYMRIVPLLSSRALPITDRLKYVFVGHMHTYHSSFDVTEEVDGTTLSFLLQYLGSLGRTSISEINEHDLDRTVPIFTITDTSYSYNPFTITLLPGEEIIRKNVVQSNKEKYDAEKAIRELKEANVFGETPLECIERQLQPTPEMLTLFSRIYHNNIESEIQDLIKEAEIV